MKDDMGDRLKSYEGVEADRRGMPFLPLCIRLDGKGFSKWTAKLRRPFDERLSTLMKDVTKHLVAVTNARIGYTQSDEISLVLMQDESNYESELWFDQEDPEARLGGLLGIDGQVQRDRPGEVQEERRGDRP